MSEPAETLRRPKEEKTPEEKRKEFKVIKGGGKKRWGPGAKAGVATAATTAVITGVVTAALGETDNLPDPLQSFYDQAFHPGKVVEEKSEEAKGKYDVEEASEDLTNIVNETKTQTETTPPVIETPTVIEDEGVIIPSVEGLRYDKEINTFYAEAGNPYNLEVGEKAGVFVKDAVEINEVMESSIGLRPEVIEVMQKEIMEKEKKFVYPFPIDLEQARGIKIREVADKETDDWTKSEGFFWDNNTFLEISNVPIGTKIDSPVNSQEYLIWDNTFARPNWYALRFEEMIPEVYKGSLLFKNERVDSALLDIEVVGISLLPPGTEKNIAKNEFGGYSFLTETKIGEPIAEVVSKDNIPCYDDPDYNPEAPYNPDVPSISMFCDFTQLKNKDGQVELLNVSKSLSLGLPSLSKIGNILVFINPAHD